MKNHRYRQNRKQVFVFCLILTLALMPQTASLFLMRAAALNFYVENPVSGTIEKPMAGNVVTHYEFNIAETAETASFQVSIAGEDFTEPLTVNVQIAESENHPVSAVSINGGGPSAVIPNASPFTIAFTLNNADFYGFATGSIRLDIAVQSTNASLGSVPFIVNRGSPDASEENTDSGEELIDPNAQNDYSDYDGGDSSPMPEGLQSFADILTDEAYLPEIVIDGNTARLTYLISIASWSGGEAGENVLTLNDISRLERDMPIDVPGPKLNPQAADYTVTLPASHINAVLAAKAEEIAVKLSAGTYREEPSGHIEQSLRLEPVHLPPLQAETEVLPAAEGFASAGYGELALYADTQTLLEAGEQMSVEADVFYKGVASPVRAILALPLSDAELFPVLGQNREMNNASGGIMQGTFPLGENDSPKVDNVFKRPATIGLMIALAVVIIGLAVLLILRARTRMRVR